MKNENKKKPEPKKKKPGSEILFASDGRVLQKNEGKWNFKWHHNPKTIVLDLEISKFIDTSLINVDLHPTWIRVTIKGKILQLVLEEEVQVSSVLCERSKATGHLVITMIKFSVLEDDVSKVRREELEEEKKKASCIQKKVQVPRNRRYERLFEPSESVDIHNILEQVKLENTMKSGGIVDVKTSSHENQVPEDFIDDPDVPPLC